jgi:hypothetical protein
MHDFIMGIGSAVINFFYSIDTSGLTDALSIMGIGMLGIFIVTGVIILSVTLLNKIFSR